MMKRVALDSAPHSSGDAKTVKKLQNLMQDYRDLQKDVEFSRNKLENMKQRKETLRAEVRFLRRRYKYLLKSKSLKLPQERRKELVQQVVENHRQKTLKVQMPNKKEPGFRDLPPLPKPSNKTRVYTGYEISLPNTIPSFDPQQKGKKHAVRFNPTPTSTLKPKGRLYKGKEVVTHQTPMPVIDLNKQESAYNGTGTGAAMHAPSPYFDLTHNEATFSGKQTTFQSGAPIFDLNQRSVEEEDYLDNSEMGRQEQMSDLKLSLCRNVGEGSIRVVKRKISWQDPVALRV